MADTMPDPSRDGERDDQDALPAELFEEIRAAVEAGDAGAAAAAVAELHAADLADLVEQLSPGRRQALLELVWDRIDHDFLAELEEGVRDAVLEELEPARLAEALRTLDSDDVVYLLGDLVEEAQAELLDALEPGERAAVSRSLTYPEYSAGRLMQSEVVKAPGFWTVGQMIDELRANDHLPDQFYDVIVVGPAMRPLGKIPLSALLTHPRPVTLESLMGGEPYTVHVEDSQEDVAYAFNQYHLVSCPVVDDDGRLAGVITIDDAMEALDEEAEEDIKRLGGVGDEEISDRVWSITRRRFPWLAVNLATAVLASVVIGLFDAALEQVVALAILMPIVASMGGNAGTQTLTVAVRALATRDLTPTNALRIVGRETLVGLFNGLAFAVIMAAVAWAWFGNPAIGAVIAAAMVVNLLVAGLAGILVPLALERMGADPALASGTFVTTVTDVVGFFAFLGLAAAVLL
jgi:magnesium transporter